MEKEKIEKIKKFESETGVKLNLEDVERNANPCVQFCKFDPLKDVQEVIPNLGVDIDDMLQTGIVKDSGETLDNNGIDDPNQIIGRVRDVFDALDASRIIKKYGKKNPAKATTEVSNITNTSNE